MNGRRQCKTGDMTDYLGIFHLKNDEPFSVNVLEGLMVYSDNIAAAERCGLTCSFHGLQGIMHLTPGAFQWVSTWLNGLIRHT